MSRMRGAALIELLAALGVFVITSTIYIELTNQKLRILEQSEKYYLAVEAADTWLARCRAMGAAELDLLHDKSFAVPGLARPDRRSPLTVSVARTAEAGVREVTVSVAWQTGGAGRPQSVTFKAHVVR